MNLWHEVPYTFSDLTALNCIIEISRGSKIKYEIDKELGILKVDRILYSAVRYPDNYGFFPQTLADDDDPLDCLVLSQEIFIPLSLCRVRPIGVLSMEDQGKLDDKVIAVCLDDPEYNQYTDISELPKHKLSEIRDFFEIYKKLENKKTVVKEIQNAKVAHKIIEESITLYKKTYPDSL